MTGNSYFDVVIHIFELEYSTSVSYLYGLMRHILYLICTAQHCKFTVPLLNTVLSQIGPYMAFNICMQCDN